MTGWYIAFIAGVVLLRLWATPRDRNALTIILVASVVSTFLVHFVTCHIQAAWKLVIPGAVETLTILAMMTWANPQTALKQAILLLVAWWAHLQCYVDCQTGGNVIYDNYENLLAIVAIGQLLACHDTLFSIARNAHHQFNLLVGRGRGVLAASGGDFMVHNPDKPTEQKHS